jgi:hypothetical protein
MGEEKAGLVRRTKSSSLPPPGDSDADSEASRGVETARRARAPKMRAQARPLFVTQTLLVVGVPSAVMGVLLLARGRLSGSEACERVLVELGFFDIFFFWTNAALTLLWLLLCSCCPRLQRAAMGLNVLNAGAALGFALGVDLALCGVCDAPHVHPVSASVPPSI